MIISRSIHVAANGIISFFLWLSSIPLCVRACVRVCVCVCACVRVCVCWVGQKVRSGFSVTSHMPYICMPHLFIHSSVDGEMSHIFNEAIGVYICNSLSSYVLGLCVLYCMKVTPKFYQKEKRKETRHVLTLVHPFFIS